MKKVSFQTIANTVERENIIDATEVRNALATSRTVGRPLISILLANTQRYADNGARDTRLKKTLAELLEIPLFENANDIRANIDLTRQAGLDGIDKTKTFFVDYDGKTYLHMVDPMNTEKNDKAIAIAKIRECEYCMMTQVVINTVMTRDITPIIIADRAKVVSGTDTDGENQESDEEASTDIAKMFNDIINAGINSRASDVHLCPERKKSVIRFRIDGILKDYMPLPSSALEKLYNYIVSQAKIAEPEKPKEPRDGSMEFKYGESQIIPLRISSIENTDGRPDLCVRILNSQEMSLEGLGMCKEHQDIIARLFKMTKGIVLFVGPTGSGKSTSMYAGIRSTDYMHRRIMTCEDPVEQKMENILQVSINEEAGMSYSEAIKSFLRHDPDIIVVGEIRDNKVGTSAITASETGHLVISTLHCNNAPAAIPRLKDIDITEQSIATSLSAVISQRLVRRICPHCKQKYMLPANHPWRERYNLGDGEVELAKGKGCADCEGSGYKGRIVLTEIMICNREIRAAIERNAPSIEIEQLAMKNGYHPLIEDGIQKAKDCITTFDEIDVLFNDIV